MVPCLARGGPLVLVGLVCDVMSCDSSPSPLSSGVGSKVLRTVFDDSELAGGVGPGDEGVRDGAGIEARFAALAAWALWGREAWDMDCGRVNGAEFIGVDGVVPR